MEENQILNTDLLYSQQQQQMDHMMDDDEDLLNEDNDHNEIEDLIQQSNLSILDEHSASSRKNKKYQQQQVIQVESNDDEEEEEKFNDSNEMEFERFMKQHEIQLNYKLDSDRSQFTQESCSPADSAREGQAFIFKAQAVQQQLQDIIDSVDDSHLKAKRKVSDYQDVEKLELHQQNSESFSLMNGNSPSKDSLLGSFQGQITSSFPQNLRETAQYKLRDPDSNHDPKYSDHNTLEAGSGSDSSRFNNSFYKFEGQKIKDFEKSTMIKFEEIDGDSQLESDPHRKASERISDRIYERVEPQPSSTQFKDDDPFSAYYQGPDDNGETQEQQQTPQYYDMNQQNLFVITEEDPSEEIQSSYYVYNRMYSGEQQQERNLTSELFSMNNTNEQDSRDQSVQKSKSQPIYKGRQSINKNSTSEKKGDRVKTDTSPIGKKQSPTFRDQHMHNISLFEKQNSRISQDSPYLQQDQDQLSNYFQRLHSNQHLRQSQHNTTQPDFLMSEEDLLSNVDRISKILPTNEISEEDCDEMPRLREHKQLIDHLRCESTNRQTLLMIKESQLNLLQMKNEELEEEVAELNSQIEGLGKKTDSRDAETQVNEFERKKIREKKKYNSSSMKKTPSRIVSEVSQEYSDFGLYLKSSIMNNQFDTPQLKNDISLKDSPSTGKRGLLSKQQSQSFTSEDMGQLKQQISYLKSQLQRSEENNLMLQQKMEKYKGDKIELKEKYFKTNIEKVELEKQCDKHQVDSDYIQKKFEGLKAEILDYRRQLDFFKLKYENPQSKIEKSTSSSSLQPIINDQGMQTEIHFIPQREQNSSQTRSYNDSRQQQQRPGSVKKDIFIFDQNDTNSTFSSKSLNNNNITIINNKQDLNQLLERAKDYELISMKLQNEINDHRKLLKDNQDKFANDLAQQKDYKRKLRKREAKIDKCRLRIKQLEKENADLKSKSDEHSQKLQDVRIRMESKIQEKEFKIISLKNQMKHFSISSGLVTPITPSMSQGGVNKMYSQNDLYNVINSMIKQSFQQQQIQFQKQDHKTRAKSQEQPLYQFNPSFYDENLLDEPRIMTPNNILLGDNPSFSNNDNATFQNQFFSQQKDNSKLYSTPSGRQPTPVKSSGNHHQLKDSQPLQHIFNSSIKRIQQELESIKDFSSQNTSKHISRVQNFNDRKSKRDSSGQSKLPQDRQIRVINQGQNQVLVYEDSLQTDHHAEHTDNDNSNGMTQFVESKIEELRKRRIVADQQRATTIRNNSTKTQNDSQKKTISLGNTHTFRQISTQQKNSPNRFMSNNLELHDNQLFNNTQGFGEKEQNVSIFYDFKPQFDNSNYTNTSILNHTSNQLKSLKNEMPIKFESHQQSLNNSIKTPGGLNHIRLHSNLQRDIEIQESSDEIGSSQLNSSRRKFKSISDEQRQAQQLQLSTLGRYEDMVPKQSRQVPLRQKVNHSNSHVKKKQQHLEQIDRITPETEGYRSQMSNYSQKLDDLKKKYGRLN